MRKTQAIRSIEILLHEFDRNVDLNIQGSFANEADGQTVNARFQHICCVPTLLPNGMKSYEAQVRVRVEGEYPEDIPLNRVSRESLIKIRQLVMESLPELEIPAF